MKKILFVDPGRSLTRTASGGCIQGNMGLEYLAAVSQAVGHTIQIIQPPLNDISYSEIIQLTANFNVVAISCMTWNSAQAIYLAKEIRKTYPHIKLAVGGIGPTGMPEMFSPYFDAVIIGEGEESFLGWLAGKIQDGTIYAERDLNWDGKITQWRDTEVLKKSRMRGIWPILYAQQRAINILYGRGCYNNCSFCCSPLTWKRQVIWRDPKLVAEELLTLADTGINSVDFLDPTFNASSEKVLALCEALIENRVSERIKWTAMIDPAKEGIQKLLPLMAEAGCAKVGLGIEDPTPQARRDFRKSSADVDRCYQTAETAWNLGMLIRAYLIIGAPQQTMANISTIKEALLSWPIDEPRVSIFVPFPGTPAWKEYQGQIIEPDFAKWDTNHLVVRGAFTQDEIIKIRTELLQTFYNSENYRGRKSARIKSNPNFTIAYEQFEKSFLIPKGYLNQR